jgi:hypothetical protein
MHSASAVDIYRAQRKHINYSIWPMRISRYDLRRRYSNSLVIDAGSRFTLRACSQATKDKWICSQQAITILPRGTGATGAAGATAPIAQTVREQHGDNRLPFLPELHFEICALFTGVGIYNYFKAMFKQSLLNFLPVAAVKLMLNQAIYVRLLILFCTVSTVQRIKEFHTVKF